MNKKTIQVPDGRRHRSIDGSAVAVCDITRHVRPHIQFLLWGKTAGRCEFAGCNKALWKSSVTQEQVNIAQRAHIFAFSDKGPRGNIGIPKHRLNDLENLMLVCHECHRKLDNKKDGGRYSATFLRRMKAEHEERIDRVTGIAVDKHTHIVLYGANIGDHSSPLNYRHAAPALFPERYPAADAPIELSTVNSSFSDRDVEFWTLEAKNLQRKFDRRIRERLASGEINHLSVFSLAPQPLLILLGSLLGDIVPSEVYQRHREPPTWEWPAKMLLTPGFELTPPIATSGPPALVIALSGTVTADRITSVLGCDASIWAITVANPHNDIIKSRAQLSQLRSLLRRVFDQIKAAYGQSTSLHIFPAAPVSAAIEIGRSRMPKADMPWRIYDQLNARDGFVSALSISYGGCS
jgi:hypothetical protein